MVRIEESTFYEALLLDIFCGSMHNKSITNLQRKNKL